LATATVNSRDHVQWMDTLGAIVHVLSKHRPTSIAAALEVLNEAFANRKEIKIVHDHEQLHPAP
jgi:hypothetical protein